MDILVDSLWGRGVNLALKAYSVASDAYAQAMPLSSVALWSVLIAAGLVLLEWLLSFHRRQPGA